MAEGGMYDNNNTGALFKNKRATTEKHPTHTGSATIDGVEYWVSAWVKTKRDSDEKFFSMAYTKKERQSNAENKSQRETAAPKDDKKDWVDDDIPF